LTAEDPFWSKRQSASRLYEKVSGEVTLIRSLLQFYENKEILKTYEQHLRAMPAVTVTDGEPGFEYPDRSVSADEWNQWFYNYRMIRQDLLEFVGTNRSAILASFEEAQGRLATSLAETRDQFRQRRGSWASLGDGARVPRDQITSFQQRLANLQDLAKSFYPQNLLELERQPAVFWFILIGWAGIASAFCPVIILSLYWENMTKWGAFAGLLSGFVVVTFWVFYPMDHLLQFPGIWDVLAGYGFDPHGLGTPNDIIYEMVPGFLFSFLSIFLVSWFTEARDQSREDLEDVREQAVDAWELPES
jgi:hypothetical protein